MFILSWKLFCYTEVTEPGAYLNVCFLFSIAMLSVSWVMLTTTLPKPMTTL
ncbi:mCG146871 [Mus musculus]|nr:mCG146871 [Mus musculus]